MPKLPRSTTDPLGQKLLAVLREKGTPDDLNALAQALDVKVQSTYDWIKHGRISKDRYARLVEWSGRSLHWWFDLPDNMGVLTPAEHRQFHAEPNTDWPVPGLTIDDVRARLTPEQRGEVAGFIKGLLATRPVTVAETRKLRA
jgi:hypothetical protein